MIWEKSIVYWKRQHSWSWQRGWDRYKSEISLHTLKFAFRVYVYNQPILGALKSHPIPISKSKVSVLFLKLIVKLYRHFKKDILNCAHKISGFYLSFKNWKTPHPYRHFSVSFLTKEKCIELDHLFYRKSFFFTYWLILDLVSAKGIGVVSSTSSTLTNNFELSKLGNWRLN